MRRGALWRRSEGEGYAVQDRGPHMTSVLARAGSLKLESEPFPHLVIDNALDPDVYEVLAAQFPALDIVNHKGRPVRNNRLYQISARAVETDERISEEWKEFFRYHVSNRFWQEALPLLKPQLLAINPELERMAGARLEDFRSVVREKRFAPFDAEICLECHFGINSPVTRTSSVRLPHLDHPSKLFNALLYCRMPQDDTPGGELILYRCIAPPAYAKGSSIMPTRIVEAKRIAYRANRLVLFLSSPWSVHGVAPRPKTPHVRRYVNFLCEFGRPLFELERLPLMARFYESARAAMHRRFSRRTEAMVQQV